MIKDAIDEFNGQGGERCSAVVGHLVVMIGLPCCVERHRQRKWYLCSSLCAVTFRMWKKRRLFREIVQSLVGRKNVEIVLC